MSQHNHKPTRIEAIERAWKWLNSGAVIIDTETTGLEWGCEVVEVSVIKVRTGKVLLNTLVKPTKPIPDEATAIHGITNKMVHSAPPFSTVIMQVLKVTQGLDIIAWNSAFDLKMLLSTLHKTVCYKPIEQDICTHLRNKSDGKDIGGNLNINRWHCGMLNYAQFKGDWNDAYGDFKWHSLENAAKQLDIEIPSTRHRALEDCMLTREVIMNMVNEAPF